MRHVPDPLEWHPAYADHTWLIDFLGRDSPRRDVIYVAPMRRISYAVMAQDAPLEPMPDPVRLTLRKCAGPAPYVGEPFLYAWWALIDDLGRAVAGDSWIVHHRPDSWIYAAAGCWPDPYAVPLRP